jgi:hypothetical protein
MQVDLSVALMDPGNIDRCAKFSLLTTALHSLPSVRIFSGSTIDKLRTHVSERYCIFAERYSLIALRESS